MTDELKNKIETLKLGSTQENFLTTTKEALSTIVKDNEAQSANITKAQTDAENALRVAQNRYKSIDYANIDAMITALNTLPYSDALNQLGKGDLIITVNPDEPDFWIVERTEDFVDTNDKNTLINKEYLEVQFGYLVISKNNNDKVDIEGMVKADNDLVSGNLVVGDASKKIKDGEVNIKNVVTAESNLLANKIIVGNNGSKKIKSSKYIISDLIETEDWAIPTTTAVNNAIANLATKEELANAGKVKDVYLNGTSVLDTTNGNAKINIKVNNTLPTVETDDATGEQYINIVAQAEGQETTPLKATLTPVQKSELKDFLYNSDNYKAIKLEAKVVVTSVYNSSYNSIITQPVVVTESGVNYIYYLVAIDGTEEDTYYYQTIEGNVVGGGVSSENVLYQHHITFSTTTPIEIPSITTGTGNSTYNRTATITNAQIVVLLDRNSVTNTDMIDLSEIDKRSIHGFVTTNISGYDYQNACPIVSIVRKRAAQCYRITFVDYKILSSTNWVISDLVTLEIPYDNITIGFDLVTPIITK